MIESMRRNDIIRPLKNPWASHVILMPKKDGTQRISVDHRCLDSVTKKDVYLLPRIEDILDTLGEAILFSTLDLAAGYWQIQLDPAMREKSAFTTH